MRLAIAALVLAAAPAGAQQVFVIDSTGGGDFLSLKAAALAAPSESILLLRSTGGEPNIALVDQKSFTVVGDTPPGSPPLLSSSLWLEGVPAGSTFVLRNVAVSYMQPIGNDGTIFVEESRVGSGTVPGGGGTIDTPCWQSFPGSPGLRLESSDMTAVRCAFLGGDGGDADFFCPAFPGGPGAVILDFARFAAWDCDFVGGSGGDDLSGALASNSGGTGVIVDPNSSAAPAWSLLAGGEVLGGTGGQMHGNGGYGLRVIGATSVVHRLDVSIAGGAGNGIGQDGAATAGAALPAPLAGPYRSMRVDTPLREQQTGQLTLHGVAGEVVFYFASKLGGFTPKLGKGGVFALDMPLGPMGLAVITDPSGDLTLPFTAPNLLLPGDEGNVWLLQPFFLGPSGAKLGSPTVFVLLDSTL